MKIEYSKRAISDIDGITEYFTSIVESGFGRDIETALREAVSRIADMPRRGSSVKRRIGIRMILVKQFRYKIFYKVARSTITVIHIRHTSRRPWTGD